MPDQNLPITTDDVARRIEYVTHGKWTLLEYKQVVSILRFYRHQSVIATLEREAKEGGTKNVGDGEAKIV
jgi:hypothetical protein